MVDVQSRFLDKDAKTAKKLLELTKTEQFLQKQKKELRKAKEETFQNESRKKSKIDKAISEKKGIKLFEKLESKAKLHEDYLAHELAKIETNN